ncbi:GNAT family N-acetyltransferase [Actinacidiphila glaucinigra]|uniref:GNAT family N-acetyltransferase n=1 Tax=Actinacidiphila glaucinigra TaxID=235986 RepID=UPI0033B00274
MFPDTVLRTERFVLRPFTPDDAHDTWASCVDPLTQRWLPLPRPYTPEEAMAWCTTGSHALRASGDGIHFAVAERDGGRLVGTVGLKRTDWRVRTSEVGYWVSPWARGRGIAAEATRALATWLLAEQGFRRLELRAATGNTASQRVAAKAGLRREGVLRDAGFVHTGRVDLVVFSLVPGDLAAAPADDRSVVADGSPTEAELDVIEERAASASPGPWTPLLETRAGIGGASFLQVGAAGGAGDEEFHLSRVTAGREVAGPDEQLDADLDFIASARQDVPRLLAEVRRLRAALAAGNS